MKKRSGIVLFGLFFAVCFFASCGKMQIEPNPPLQEVLIKYKLDNINAFAAADNGTAYMLCYTPSDDIFVSGNCMYRFDAEGEQTGEYLLSDYTQLTTIDVGEDEHIVYFTGQGMKPDLCLFALNAETGEVEELCAFPYFQNAKKVVYINGRVYVLGQQQWAYNTVDEAGDYNFVGGEKLVYYDINTKEIYNLGFEYPINIAAAKDDILAVLGYLETEGYCIMEYDPKKDAMQVRQRLERFSFDNFAVCNNGDSLLYSYDINFGLMMVDYENPEIEVEIYEDVFAERTIEAAGDRIYCMDEITKYVVSFPLSAVRRENKAVKLISSWGNVAPYGCGYALERIGMSWDQIVLKTLAQDKDYDLCIGSTYDSASQVMKDSESFYPLNDIPGVEEYLNRCFPYVKEAATKEDGTIWMLPFLVEGRGLLIREDELLQAGIPISQGMTYTELASAVHGLSEQQKSLLYLPMYIIARSCMDQYLSHSPLKDSFQEYIEALKQLYIDLPFRSGQKISNDLLLRYEFFGRDKWVDQWYIEQYKEVGYTFCSFPSAGSSGKNVIYCYFIAVNPNSSRLKETLSYIADLTGYLAAQENVWYFTDYQAEPGSFEEQIYQIYQNGEIPFSVDADVYLTDMEKVFFGEIPVEQYVKDVEQKLLKYQKE